MTASKGATSASHPDTQSSEPPHPLESHLFAGMQRSSFDMDDAPDSAHINRYPLLNKASDFLNEELGPAYREADHAATRHQTRHRLLAKIAITLGGSSIALAVVQLALKSSGGADSAHMVAIWEIIAAVLAAIAVIFGLFSKYEHKWLVERHIAERLRMLKFRALGNARFWNLDVDGWKTWVKAEAAKIREIDEVEQVKDWAGEDFTARNADTFPTRDFTDDDRAVAVYYRVKRVQFQASYFDRQSKRLRQNSTWLTRAGLPLFTLSILAVIVHFAADYLYEHHKDFHLPLPENVLHFIGIWALAAAVLLPLLSLCIRAWIGAFEFSRSAYLFQAKHKALQHFSEHLHTNTGWGETLRRIEDVEDFLEHEHKEWLRLVMSAEWFI